MESRSSPGLIKPSRPAPSNSWSCRSVIHLLACARACACVCVCTDLNHDEGLLVCQEQQALVLRWTFKEKLKETHCFHTLPSDVGQKCPNKRSSSGRRCGTGDQTGGVDGCFGFLWLCYDRPAMAGHRCPRNKRTDC